LGYLINSTNHLKKVKISALPSNRMSDFQLLRSLIRLGRNKNLSELTASPTQTQQRDPETAHRISKQLKQLRKLESFSLNFSLYFYSHYIFSRYPIRSLASLDLTIPVNLDFHQELFSHYFSRLSQYNQLEHLLLIFKENHKTSPQEIQRWGSFFKRLTP